MGHIDTLQVYKDYLKAGYTDEQADCAVHALNASFDSVVTRDYLDSKLRLIYLIGAAIFTVCCIPILEKLLK